MSWVPSSQGSCAHASQGGSLRSHWETQRLHQLPALCPLPSHWEEGLGRKGWSAAGAQSEQDCPGSISVCAPPSKVSSPPEKKKKKVAFSAAQAACSLQTACQAPQEQARLPSATGFPRPPTRVMLAEWGVRLLFRCCLTVSSGAVVI